jgi:undecaprenyl-diphosphatase
MNGWEATILGIVEGLTEYLPVSSTGHLILTQRLLGIPENDASNAYAICIQAGAILAVLTLYWRRMVQMTRGMAARVGLGGNAEPEWCQQGAELARNIIVAFLPAAVVGLLLNDWIERVLFGLQYTVFAWFVGGVAILVTMWWRGKRIGESGRPIEALTWQGALVIGLIQCIAMWPGTSRSLVTIVGGVLVGLQLGAAVEFSFLLGVVTLLAATVYKMKDAGPIMMETYGLQSMLIGSAAAWVSAVIAVKWMVSFLKRHGMEIFGYYRIALALTVGWALWRGWIEY